MILIYGGWQAAASDGSDAGVARRLAPEQVADLRLRLPRLLAHLRPSLVLGAAASGTDLLVLEAAAAEGIEALVRLPFDMGAFRATSVEPKGDIWVAMYDRLLSQPTGIEVVEGSKDPGSSSVYLEHNAVMLDHARARASSGDRVWAVVVRGGDAPAEVSVTDDLAARAEGQQLLVLDLDPTQAIDERPSAFVAMPYGKKFDPVSRRIVDCDVLFDRVYVAALEDADVEWARADLDTDTGIIHVGMIEALANSDLVLADLTTLNANVAYELGLRHAMAAGSTILVAAGIVVGSRPFPLPFDVQPIRTVRIKRSLVMTDEEAEAAIRLLRPVVAGARQATLDDSPVHAWFEHRSARPLKRRSEKAAMIERETSLRKLVGRAVLSSSTEDLVEVASAVGEAVVPESVRLSLRLEIGQALLAERRYQDARHVLALAEPGIEDPRRLVWLQRQAMVLRRLGEVAADGGRDPEPEWALAEGLLVQAMDYGDTEETCGIAAGLTKRQLMTAQERGDDVRARALLARAAELYERGFLSEPSYYAGVNLIAILRIRGQHYGGDDQALSRLSDLLPVVRFFAKREADADGDNLWAAATLAELALHLALLKNSEAPVLDAAVDLYAALISRPRSADVLYSARSQLEFFIKSGDSAGALRPLVEMLG